MTVHNISGRLGLLCLIVLSPLVMGGRPVYHALSLQELIARSDLIAVVRKGDPFEVKKAECEYRLNVEIIEVLFSKQGLPQLHPRDTLAVFPANYQSVRADCLNRKAGGSGFSYAAVRYGDWDPGFLSSDSGNTFIIFLQKVGSGFLGLFPSYEVAAAGAFERMDKRKKILELLK